MQNNPKPYEKYKHFKGNTYQILARALHSETGEEMVVYQSLSGDFAIYVRPLSLFIDMLDPKEYPQAKQRYRFELLTEEQGNNTVATKLGDSWKANEPTTEANIHTNGADIHTTSADIHTTSDMEDSFQLHPLLLEFLDSDTYEDKLNILVAFHNQLTHDIINTIAASLDIEVKEGDLEQRYEEVKNCLLMMEKFECNRIR